MNTCEIGRAGENKAVLWLEDKGYKILLRNFRKRGFEIDIVALDKNRILRFIEVKTVHNGCLSDAAFSIEKRNIINYLKGVDAFLSANKEYSNSKVSMDAIIVTSKDLHYYENITSDLVF